DQCTDYSADEAAHARRQGEGALRRLVAGLGRDAARSRAGARTCAGPRSRAGTGTGTGTGVCSTARILAGFIRVVSIWHIPLLRLLKCRAFIHASGTRPQEP